MNFQPWNLCFEWALEVIFVCPEHILISGKPLMESFEQTVSADNLSSSAQSPDTSSNLEPSGGRENFSSSQKVGNIFLNKRYNKSFETNICQYHDNFITMLILIFEAVITTEILS
jgi:hypothetical protein